MYPFLGKNNRHARRLKEQEERIRRFKAELKEEQFEKGDYLAMVIGAFWALWPVLAIVIALILGVALLLFH